jgi:hypothetical protein
MVMGDPGVLVASSTLLMWFNAVSPTGATAHTGTLPLL